MERLSHDLNLALEESNCNKQGRKKFGLRRRTRSTGNLRKCCNTHFKAKLFPMHNFFFIHCLAVTCIVGFGEDGSSSSPPQPAIVSHVLSDSDDPQLNQLQQGNRVSHFCPGGNFESDSFNENFSPAKPPNARRKRKFKKMAIDYPDNCNGRSSPPLIIGTSPHINVKNCSVLNLPGSTPFSLITKKKRIFKYGCQEGHRSSAFCGKRKWSHRERSELGEMRERSFSGGCASKTYFCGKTTSKTFLDFKNSKKYLPIDKVPKFKDKLLTPVISAGMKNGLETALQSISLSSFTPNQIPGSSSFNFIYRPPSTTCDTTPNLFGKPLTKPPSVFSAPFFAFPDNDTKIQNAKSSKKHEKGHNRKHKSHRKSNEGKLRNPLQFDDTNIDMDCTLVNETVSSSSISSSDSEGVVTNDSDREGDDELTDWPGNEEISSFNKNLSLKVQRPSPNGPTKTIVQQSAKTSLKKDKFLPKQGLSSCKNKTDSAQKTDINLELNPEMQLMEDDTVMSDSGSVLDTYSNCVASPNEPTSFVETYSSFADVKNAGLLNNNVNEAFFHSFNALQDGRKYKDNDQYIPRNNFTLQKTSSSDLNLSEKSPQSDHCYSEHSASFGPPTVRKLRAGCRRLRDERPGFTILSAANEQLSRFLQDSCQDELKLPCFNNDSEEKEKLASLAKLYSLDMSVELGRPVLRKTSNTTQSIRVEQSMLHCQRFLDSQFKRRCYDECSSEQLFSLPLDISSLSHDTNKPMVLPIDPEMCGSSTNKSVIYSQEPFPTVPKAPAVNDLSQSQDYDQGFSEPSLRNSPHLDPGDELKTHDKSDGGFSSD